MKDELESLVHCMNLAYMTAYTAKAGGASQEVLIAIASWVNDLESAMRKQGCYRVHIAKVGDKLAFDGLRLQVVAIAPNGSAWAKAYDE